MRVLVRVAWMRWWVLLVVLVVLPAVRVFAWAGRQASLKPAAARMSRMPQASTTHADLVRTRMVPSLSFLRNSALNALARRRAREASGKESELSRRYLRQQGTPHRRGGGRRASRSNINASSAVSAAQTAPCAPPPPPPPELADPPEPPAAAPPPPGAAAGRGSPGDAGVPPAPAGPRERCGAARRRRRGGGRRPAAPDATGARSSASARRGPPLRLPCPRDGAGVVLTGAAAAAPTGGTTGVPW